jgi:arylsulfatase
VNDDDYQVPFRFTGKIDKLTIKLNEPVRTTEERNAIDQKTREAKLAAH